MDVCIIQSYFHKEPRKDNHARSINTNGASLCRGQVDRNVCLRHSQEMKHEGVPNLDSPLVYVSSFHNCDCCVLNRKCDSFTRSIHGSERRRHNSGQKHDWPVSQSFDNMFFSQNVPQRHRHRIPAVVEVQSRKVHPVRRPHGGEQSAHPGYLLLLLTLDDWCALPERRKH
jgi:hypothetical protein